MALIFLSYCNDDKNQIDYIIDNLNLNPAHYSLWHYKKDSKNQPTMDEVKTVLSESDIFIIVITQSSLNSLFVQEELTEAIKLKERGQIKAIYPILLDNPNNIDLASKIIKFFRSLPISYTNSTDEAIARIKMMIQRY
jgi:hypothetical protein